MNAFCTMFEKIKQTLIAPYYDYENFNESNLIVSFIYVSFIYFN